MAALSNSTSTSDPGLQKRKSNGAVACDVQQRESPLRAVAKWPMECSGTFPHSRRVASSGRTSMAGILLFYLLFRCGFLVTTSLSFRTFEASFLTFHGRVHDSKAHLGLPDGADLCSKASAEFCKHCSSLGLIRNDILFHLQVNQSTTCGMT